VLKTKYRPGQHIHMARKGNENMNHIKASMHSDKRDIVFSFHRRSKDNIRQLPVHELFNGSACLRFTPACGYPWRSLCTVWKCWHVTHNYGKCSSYVQQPR